MDLDVFFNQQFDEHAESLKATRVAIDKVFVNLVTMAVETITSGGKIVFFGNGGSAADSQHLATELTVRYKQDRKPLAALALTTDTSALSAIGNDFGFDDLFSRQVYALVGENDLAIGISTSGNSENVVRGLQAAKAEGARAVAWTGEGGGRLASIADLLVAVPSKDTARIQEMHILIGHMLCGALETELDLI